MSLPSVSPDMLNAGTNRFLSRYIPMLGISLSEMDYLRGWRDDFLGDVIADQYTAVSSGAGSGGALQFAHGGVYRLTAGATSGFYHFLFLGNAADGFATLDADLGWVQLALINVSHTTNTLALLGAGNSAGTRQLFVGLRTDVVANNWLIRCLDAFGTTNIDTGVTATTGWHWLATNVSRGRVELSLDGGPIGTCTTNVPTDVLTPVVQSMARGAAIRYLDLDYVAWIPRNLA